MKRVQTLFAEHRSRIATHPFFDWLRGTTLAPRDRFVFTPVMVDFTMGFADMNKWFLSYENPQNDLERSINQHTQEDRTHSRLFVENWHALGMDNQLNWSASQTVWWLYHSPATLPVRRFGWEILRLSVQHPDPLLRFALMEAIEICGDVFFGNTKQVATQLSRQTGIDYRYYGEYHHLRETGHLHTDESPFFAAQLSDEQLAQARQVVNSIFLGFGAVLDHLFQHCRGSVEHPWSAVAALGDAAMRSRSGLQRDRNPLPRAVEAKAHAPLLDFLQERQTQLSRHPFLDWLRNAPFDATEKLRRFAPLWAIDIAGYPDFNHLALSYSNPSDGAERALTEWAQTLGSHGILYLQDWRTLELDGTLGWGAGDTISFYFLSELSEMHRRNLAKITRFAYANSTPVWRWWLMTAFEAGGDPLFDALAPIAKRAEHQTKPLNYWAERHAEQPLAHARQEQLQSLMFSQPLTAQMQHRLSGMIATIFDGFEEQFTLSHQLAVQGSLLTRPGSLPPVASEAPPFSQTNPLHEPSPQPLSLGERG
jgi:hypothetical protein